MGTAVTAAIPAYPNVCSGAEGCFLANGVSAYNPGLVWATQADARRIVGSNVGPDAYYLNLKLNDPTAPARSPTATTRTPRRPSLLFSWQRIHDGAPRRSPRCRQSCRGSWLLALLAIASVAMLVGGRMVEQTRRVGL